MGEQTKIRSRIILLSIASFLVGAAVVWILPVRRDNPGIKRITYAHANYKYVKPLLAIEVGEKQQFSEYRPLLNQLTDSVNTMVAAGLASSISVYFRDLPSGRWTGVNEDKKFSPGSLLKVPLMITYLKLAEEKPEILQSKLVYEGPDENVMETIKPAQTIVKGQAYMVDDLIRRMIIYSDNNAAILLFDHVDIKAVNQVYSDLGLDFPEDKANLDYISARQYSLFFRLLYSATYLGPEMSELALNYLSLTDFRNGVKKGVNTNIPVADKFGERAFQSSNSQITAYELHDCGIVYHERHPYFLCVMTQGPNKQDLPEIIQKISKTVFTEVDKK